jgi:protein-S-isoprenylcysteine O-methyltransferase Ste14
MIIVLIVQAVGVALYVLSSLVLGLWLRRRPDQASVKTAVQVSQGFFCAGLLLPQVVGIIYPGLGNYDLALGVIKLPLGALAFLLGVACLIGGIYYMALAGIQLVNEGKGAIFFKLTQRMVRKSIYLQVRNPMMLGYCLFSLGAALSAGSTVATLGTLFLVVPAVLFNLHYFEEMEMNLRFGTQYVDYQRLVPFFIPRFTWREKAKGNKGHNA